MVENETISWPRSSSTLQTADGTYCAGRRVEGLAGGAFDSTKIMMIMRAVTGNKLEI
jgi:hypothetical protein